VYEIAIWTTNSEYRDDLFMLTTQIMFEQRLLLLSSGLQKLIKVGSNDEEIDVGQLPRIIYRGVLRYLTMSKVQVGTLDDLVQQISTGLIIQST
jgi:hypothetical protein